MPAIWACSRENRSTWGPPVPGDDETLRQHLAGTGHAGAGGSHHARLKAGLQRERLLEVLGGTVVLSPSQKSKRRTYSRAHITHVPAQADVKDFGLDPGHGHALGGRHAHHGAPSKYARSSSPGKSAAGREEDFSSVVRTMEQMAGCSDMLILKPISRHLPICRRRLLRHRILFNQKANPLASANYFVVLRLSRFLSG